MVKGEECTSLVAGVWQGVIADDTGDVVARVVVEFYNGKGKSLVVSAAHSDIQMPVGQLLVKEGEIEFTVPRLRALFLGAIQAGATNISGVWTQGGRKFDAIFQREMGSLEEVIEIIGKGAAIDLDEGSDVFVGWSWLGHLEYPKGMKLPLILRLEARSDEVVGAFVDSPSQGKMGIKVSKFEVYGSDLHFEIEGLGARFTGTRSKCGHEIGGTWEQAGLSVALVWHRNTYDKDSLGKD